jgi:hypothetical protein
LAPFAVKFFFRLRALRASFVVKYSFSPLAPFAPLREKSSFVNFVSFVVKFVFSFLVAAWPRWVSVVNTPSQ